MNPTTDAARTEQLVTTMTERMTTLTRTLSSWMQEQEHSLAEVEQHVVGLLKELGASLVAGLCSLAPAPQPSRALPVVWSKCSPISESARPRSPPCSVRSAFGVPTICAPPVVTASTRSMPSSNSVPAPLTALDELLALLGATQDSFVAGCASARTAELGPCECQ